MLAFIVHCGGRTARVASLEHWCGPAKGRIHTPVAVSSLYLSGGEKNTGYVSGGLITGWFITPGEKNTG